MYSKASQDGWPKVNHGNKEVTAMISMITNPFAAAAATFANPHYVRPSIEGSGTG